MNDKIKNIGGGFGGDGQNIGPWGGPLADFLDNFQCFFSCSFLGACLEGLRPPRNILFNVFTAEIQCFLRFHEVRRGMLFAMNFKLLVEHFGNILAVKN